MASKEFMEAVEELRSACRALRNISMRIGDTPFWRVDGGDIQRLLIAENELAKAEALSSIGPRRSLFRHVFQCRQIGEPAGQAVAVEAKTPSAAAVRFAANLMADWNGLDGYELGEMVVIVNGQPWQVKCVLECHPLKQEPEQL